MYMLGVVCTSLLYLHVSLRLSYLSLLSAIWYLSPPKPQNVTNFWFFRCTYLFGHVYMSLGYYRAVLPPWHDSAKCSIFELHTWIRPIMVCTSQLLYCRMEGPKAIPFRVGFSFQTSTFPVSMTFNYGFEHSVRSGTPYPYVSLSSLSRCLYVLLLVLSVLNNLWL